MRRDLDLCREILSWVEARADTWDWAETDWPGRSPEEVDYQVQLLKEAKLVVARQGGRGDFNSYWSTGIVGYVPVALTWRGQEFLDAARNDEVWARAKERVTKAAGGLPFEIVHETLLQEIRRELGLEQTGIVEAFERASRRLDDGR